jgi:hypothetical protein
MSCNSKNCDCHQNSSFIFGLIIGLVIAAVVAIVIYKNNREDVILKLKKQLEKFIDAFRPKTEKIIESFITPDIPKKKILKKRKKVSPLKVTKPEIHKIAVTLPPELIKKEKELENKAAAPKSKPRVFKK